jgi:hypothetical protein
MHLLEARKTDPTQAAACLVEQRWWCLVQGRCTCVSMLLLKP